MGDIYVFGDSIVWGAWDHQLGGWVNRLRLNLEKNDAARLVYGLGVSNESTTELLRRFKREYLTRVSTDTTEGEQTVIFQIGANDAQVNCKSGKPRTSLTQFHCNIRSLARKASNLFGSVYFLSILPINGKQLNPVPWAPEIRHDIEVQRDYNTELQRTLGQLDLGCEVIGVSNDFKLSMLSDGIHPNARGHRFIYEKVKQEVA